MTSLNHQLLGINQHIARGEFSAAIKLAQEIRSASEIALRPATALLALAFAQNGERDEAINELKAFGEVSTQDRPETLLAAGSAAFRLGALPQAAQLLDKAHELAADHPLINARLGACLLAMNRITDARPHVLKACNAMPNSAGVWLNAARVHLHENAHAAAQAALDRAQLLPDLETDLFRNIRTELHMQQGNTAQVLQDLRQEAESGELGPVTSLIQHLSAQGMHDEAWQRLREALEQSPKQVELLEVAAELAQVKGRHVEANRYLNLALEITPDNAALWRRKAMLSSRRLGVGIAREAADKALELTQEKGGANHAASLATHAHVLQEEGDTKASEAAYRDALSLHPASIGALRGLGQLLMQLGQVDEATALYEKLRDLAPIQGWNQLIHMREVPEDESVLERMEMASRRPSLEGPVQSNLLFVLAMAWEKKGNYEKAWSLATEANEATKAHLQYRPEAHRQRIEREIARFSRAFMDSRKGWGIDSKVPVFILGMPRSGTTLVEQILGSHTQTFGAGELSLVSEFIQKLTAWERKLGTRREYPECIDDLTASESARFAEKHLAELQAYAPDAQRVVDKLPHNFEHIGLIKLLFPNAKILHLKREPRDVAMSNYFVDYGAKFGGMGFAYDLTWIGEQLVDHQRLMDHWHQVFPGEILEVDYDDLVENTEDWARKIINHLDLEWEDGVLDFQQLDRAVKTASVWQVRQPIYKTSKAKWKRYAAYLEPLELALSEIPPMPVAAPLPALPAGLYISGMTALQAGLPEEAEKHFRKLLSARSAHAAAHHFLGAALAQQDKLQEARKAMRRSLELHPRNRSWVENLLKIEKALGNTDDIERLEKSLKLPVSQTEQGNGISKASAA